MIDLYQQLTAHFTLAELVTTSHRTINNEPPPDVIKSLWTLAFEMLEPTRDVFGPLRITSGYRCPELNKAIGGSKTSAHMYGCAADFVPIMGYPTADIVQWVVNLSGLEFDQVIDEYSSTANWIHIGMARPGREPRKQALTMHRGVYSPYVHGP